jgi:hypothetical protein
MEAVREITKWNVEYGQVNHDYLLDGDRIVAYRKSGEEAVIRLRSNIKIDRRGRKFVKLDPNPFKNIDEKNSMVVEIQGSRGETYYVNVEDKTCTCKGFQFRGTCKHLKK